MLLWSYFSVVSTDPSGVPLNWKPMVDEEKGDVDPLLGSEHTGVEVWTRKIWLLTQQVKQLGFVGSETYLNHPDAIIALFMGDAY